MQTIKDLVNNNQKKIGIIDAIIDLSGGTAQASIQGEDIDNIVWENGTAPIDKADIQAKVSELQTALDAAWVQKATDKANAKAKLIAGEALTEAEADTIVL
tara:strand:+ start:479 stop:781 length:303 start_codon:yes stop_codon:yes gene_type:complete